MVLPDAIDDHARSQRVVATGDPFGQLKSVPGLSAQRFQVAWRYNFAEAGVASSHVNMSVFLRPLRHRDHISGLRERIRFGCEFLEALCEFLAPVCRTDQIFVDQPVKQVILLSVDDIDSGLIPF